MPEGHFYPLFETTEDASIFKEIWEEGVGLSPSSVFKPIQPTPRCHILLAEDECTPFKAQEIAGWSPTLGSQRLGWTHRPL